MPRKRLRDLSIIQNTPNSEETNSEQQIATGSSNVSETPNEPVEIQTESCGTRRGRGRTLLKDLYELNPIEHVKVSRNNFGQSVGSKARLLAGYLGIIARNANMLPINYESWHQMPDSNKNQALDNIKERFTLEVSDAYIKKALGKKWRYHKSTVKKEYFKKDISLEEKLRNVLLGMLRYQREDAVRFWNSKKGEVLFGTSSKQKQKFTHTVGNSRLVKKHLQLFDITHRKKDESPMTSEASEIMEKLKDKKAEYEMIASSDSSVNLEDIDNRIITEVLGLERYGQLIAIHASESQAQAEVQRLRNQMAQMQASTVEQIAQLKVEAASTEVEVQRKYEELQLQLKEEAAAREAEQNRKYNKLQQQLQNMMKMFQQSQNPPS
ncbi:hypothetical protein PVK06_036387 [Gossypium arboreum]|uniref:Uncharacterized protein n=1 Tax=Gossypium arboreum TaxID=29729 RepID=A0ABR0NJS3_GOSAR|nr:hypothetical protein PVK06_036387 [Gossypium arboreum]